MLTFTKSHSKPTNLALVVWRNINLIVAEDEKSDDHQSHSSSSSGEHEFLCIFMVKHDNFRVLKSARLGSRCLWCYFISVQSFLDEAEALMVREEIHSFCVWSRVRSPQVTEDALVTQPPWKWLHLRLLFDFQNFHIKFKLITHRKFTRTLKSSSAVILVFRSTAWIWILSSQACFMWKLVFRCM